MSEEQALGASCLSPLSRPQPGARCPAACAAPGVGVLSAQAAGIPHWLGARSPGGDGWPGLCPAHLRRGPARAALPRYSEVEARDAPPLCENRPPSPKVIPAAAAAIPPPPRPAPNPGSGLAGPRPSASSLGAVTFRRKCRGAQRAFRLPFGEDYITWRKDTLWKIAALTLREDQWGSG